MSTNTPKALALLLIIPLVLVLAACPSPTGGDTTPTVYERLVIDTYSPNGSNTANTFIDLFGEAGDTDTQEPWDQTGGSPAAIASADDGNPDYPFMARIDHTGGLPSGTYYIRVRGNTALVDDFYAIRVLAPALGADLPDYQFPGLDSKPDFYEPDDEPRSGGVPSDPVSILLGNDNALSRSLDYDLVQGDIDWFILELP